MPKQKSPVWLHFDEVYDDKNILHGQCKYCKVKYVSNAQRMEKHLVIRCKKCPNSVKENFGALSKNTEDCLLKESTRKKCSQGKLISYVDKISKDKKIEMDKTLARAVFSSCSPFVPVGNNYLKKFLKLASPGYNPPSKDQLSGRIFDEEYQLLQSVMKNKFENSHSLTILSDGWTDINRVSLINIVFMTPEPVFYKAIDASGHSHTGKYISTVLSEAIEEVGPNKVHALITDNARNMKSAWSILKQKYTHLITFGCVAHGLNLLDKDIVSVSEIKKVIVRSKEIIKFFQNHVLNNSVLMEIQRQRTNKTLHLQLPVDTRWGTYCICLNSLLRIKESLQVATYDPHVSKSITEEMRQDLRGDDYFWPMLKNINDLLDVPCSIIKFLEGDYPTLMMVSKKLVEMYGDFIEKSYFLQEKIQSFVEDKYLAPVEFIEEFATSLKLNGDKVILDLGDYLTQQAVWGNKSLWSESKLLNPITWWELYFSSRDLAKLAVIILSIPATSAACERNWSSFGHIKTKKRNRLTVQKTEKFVFVKSNLHLLDDHNNYLPVNYDKTKETMKDLCISETMQLDQSLDIISDVEYSEYEILEEMDSDCASRGLSASQLIEHALWWTGPPWLSQSPEFWPSTVAPSPEHDLEERPGISLSATSPPLVWDLIDLPQVKSFNKSLPKLFRITAICQRAISRFKRVPNSSLAISPINPADLEAAKQFWIRET
ncbi:uncharacterized protein LOC130670070 [Microplitis mediator]|uniref:uncharacterized protein LOC130670070 n=1 Tax=Microplitis mediator TaxID=375433 RepID=UPI0025533B5E|nr:uncharacterized protein LOC130670070 [Microplitis mediator]